MAKLTFALDEATIRTLRALAERQAKPQSHIVREAIQVYAAREVKLSDEERERKLRLLDELMARPSTRSEKKVDAELRGIRRARRMGWRRSWE